MSGALKKESRDRELSASQLLQAVREEAQRREEALEREARLREEGTERLTETFHAALREERRVREREDLRIESGSLGAMINDQRVLHESVTELQGISSPSSPQLKRSHSTPPSPSLSPPCSSARKPSPSSTPKPSPRPLSRKPSPSMPWDRVTPRGSTAPLRRSASARELGLGVACASTARRA